MHPASDYIVFILVRGTFTGTVTDDVGTGVYRWTRQGMIVVELCTSMYTLV